MRPYQSAALDAIDAAYAAGSRAVAVELATGTGKTPLLVKSGEKLPKRTLVIAHRTELVEQAAGSVREVTGEFADIEQGDRRSNDGWGRTKFVAASIASLWTRLSEARFRPEEWSQIVIDEGHHARQGNVMYERVLGHFLSHPQPRVLLVSATLGSQRAAKGTEARPLLAVDGACYRYGIERAIPDGWLVNVRQKFVQVKGIDWGNLRVSGGDFTDKSLEAVLDDEGPLHKMIAPTLELVGSRPTIIFAPGIGSAERIAEIINRTEYQNRHKCGRAIAIHGGNDDHPMDRKTRKAYLDAVRAGRFQFLVGCDVFYEGFNLTTIAAVVMMRLTASITRYAQAVGRGTRILSSLAHDLDHDSAERRVAQIAASAKPDCLVVDFVGASTRLGLAVSTLELLGGAKADPDAIAKARKAAIESGGVDNPQEAVEDAAALAAFDRAVDARMKLVAARVDYRAVDVDAFGRAEATVSVRTASHAGDLIATLEKHGFKPDKMSAGEREAAYQDIAARRQKGLCTHKQMRNLQRAGLSGDHTRGVAGMLMAVLAQSGWRPVRADWTAPEAWSVRHDADGWTVVLANTRVLTGCRSEGAARAAADAARAEVARLGQPGRSTQAKAG